MWEEGEKGVEKMARCPAFASRRKKKTLTKTADAMKRSRFGPKIDVGSAENKSQVFGGQRNFKH